MEPEVEGLGNCQPVHIAKNEKTYSEGNTKGVARLSLIEFNEFLGLYEQKHGNKDIMNEGCSAS